MEERVGVHRETVKLTCLTYILKEMLGTQLVIQIWNLKDEGLAGDMQVVNKGVGVDEH